MKDLYYIDKETMGFHGLTVLLQYAFEDGPIVLWNVWKKPVGETMRLIEDICNKGVVGFNLAFDWFHMVKLYTTWSLCDEDWIPEEHIEQIAIFEERARHLDICVKPRYAVDLWLHAIKGPYQTLMERKDITVRRVPKRIAPLVCSELEKRVHLDGIYFRKRKDPNAPQWGIYEHKKDGEIDVAFCDIKLKFKPESSLKSLAEHLLGEDMSKFKDIMPERMPQELGYAPFALALGKPGEWNGAWPEIAREHIDHWEHNEEARHYAWKDVDVTRRLHRHEVFANCELEDVDSTLACMVPAVRWRGFALDLEKMRQLREQAIDDRDKAPRDWRKVVEYVNSALPADDVRRTFLQINGTKDTNLAQISGEFDEDDQIWVGGWSGPVRDAARNVRAARKAEKKVQLLDKMLLAGRFHASLRVIGTLSSRMAGADDFNPQGIIASREIRNCYTLADPDTELMGGDFDSFEVTIQAAAWNDENLTADLSSGKKIHVIIAKCMYPDKTEAEIIASKGSNVKDYYTDGKRGNFGIGYGGDESTLVKRIGLSEQHALETFQEMARRYPGFQREKQRLNDAFCTIKQPEGIGTKMIWTKDPKDHIESLLGFRRYFTLENKILRALFDMGTKPPREWYKLKGKCHRRDREQTLAGAAMSALFAAACGLQGNIMRAATNHVIQSTGAEITKKLQAELWRLQPVGVSPWKIRMLNIHDEIMAVVVPGIRQAVRGIVHKTVEAYRPVVPLIGMTWAGRLACWKDSEKQCSECGEVQGIAQFKGDVCISCLDTC